MLFTFFSETAPPLGFGQKEPPGPTATFQGTSKKHPEAPKEPQGAPKSSQGAPRSISELPRHPKSPQGQPKSSQGAPRDPPGAPKSPSFCPPSSLPPPDSLFLPPSLLPPFSRPFANFRKLLLANQSVHQSLRSLQGGRRHRA